MKATYVGVLSLVALVAGAVASRSAEAHVIPALPALFTVWSGGLNPCPTNSNAGQDGSGTCNLSDNAGSSTNAANTTLFVDFPLVIDGAGSNLNVTVAARGGAEADVYCETVTCTSAVSCSSTGYTAVGGAPPNPAYAQTALPEIYIPSNGYAYVNCKIPYDGSISNFEF